MSNKPLKSVHITNYYHENSGGVSTNYNNLLAAAERHRRHVRLIVPGETSRVEDVNEFGRIYFVEARQSPVVDKRYRLMLPWQYIQGGTPIRKILLEEMPDMIEIYDNYSLTLLAGIIRKGYFKRLERPMLVYFTGERLDTIVSTFVSKGKLGRWFSRRLLGNYNLPMFDFYIANSTFVAEELYEATRKEHNPRRSNYFFNTCWNFFRAPTVPFSERIQICPRGVDAAKFSPDRRSGTVRAEMRSAYGIPADSVVLMTSTRISDEKNIKILPEIMELLAKDQERDYRLLVAGAGPRAEWIAEQTENRFPGKIVLIGHLDKEKLADYYANADVFIHPNPREPFGNVVLEAMASGVPVVAPNSGGIRDYADQSNSELVEATPEGFAAGIRRVAEDSARAALISEAALKTVGSNTLSGAIDRLFATYDLMFEDFRTRYESFVYNVPPKPSDFNDLLQSGRFVN